MNGKGKACGKIILAGEHFVVKSGEYADISVPALAMPVPDIFCEVTLERQDHEHYLIRTPKNFKLGLDVDRETIESFMARSVYIAADSLRLDIKAQPMRVISYTNFPISRGFGSSAAFGVALTRAFDEYRKEIMGEKASLEELIQTMLKVEKLFHGKPSGLDTNTILAERPIRFQDGQIVREFVNKAVDFIVLDSGFRENCSELVKQVLNFRTNQSAQWSKMSNTMIEIVNDMEKSLNYGDSKKVAETISATHGILSELQLSSSEIEKIISDAKDLGALAGKVSGAGGGGAVLIATDPQKGKTIAEKLTTKGHHILAILEAKR